MSIFKKIKNLFEVKVNSAVVSRISAKENYQMVATKLIDLMEQLHKSRLENSRLKESHHQKAVSFGKEALEIETKIKAILQSGKTPSVVHAQLVLQKRALGQALEESAAKLEQTNIQIATKIIEVNDKLEEAKAQLELATVNEQFVKEGLVSPIQVEFHTESVVNDVNTLITQVNVFTEAGTVKSVSNIDAQTYLDSLKGA